MRITLIILVVLNFVSCKKDKIVPEKKNVPYIISEEGDKFRRKKVLGPNYDTITLVTRVPKYFYGTENFIIDKNSNLYYYQLKKRYKEKEWGFVCGTGLEEEYKKDTIPIFKGLDAEKMIQVSINSIDEFVKMNLQNGEVNAVKIASQNDTLKSNTYYKLIEALDKNLSFKEDRDLYFIYRTTQEEDTVLYYKNHKKYYNTDSIKWDMKRIKFSKKK